MIFGARDVNLSHLYPIPANYPPKNISTQAIQVTTENIGKLSLEFEAELRYYDNGVPFFRFQAERGTIEKPETPRMYVIRPDEWIVPLRDEIHVYRDTEFRGTFEIPKIEFPESFIEDVRTSEEIRESLKGVVSEEYVETLIDRSRKPSPTPRPIPLGEDDPVFHTDVSSTYMSDNFPHTSGQIER